MDLRGCEYERAIIDQAKLNLYYYNTLILPIRLSFYAPLGSDGVGIDTSPQSFKTIGYKKGIDKGGIKYLEKKYEGV